MALWRNPVQGSGGASRHYQTLRKLEAEKIDYCHWKSNAAIDRSASGDNDLDLLVSRSDAQQFTELLDQLGYKEVHVLPRNNYQAYGTFMGMTKRPLA